MGKKDGLTRGPPVDHYRKQIGKQNKQQTKSYSKQIQHGLDMKSVQPQMYKDARAVAGGVVAVTALVYGAVYFWFVW